MKNNEYQFWLYEHEYDDQRNLFDSISKLISKRNIRLNVMLLYAQNEPIHYFNDWVPVNFEIDIKSKNNNSIHTVKLKRRGFDSIKVLLVKHEEIPSIYYAISDCSADEFKNVFTKFISKYFPDISKVFLTTNELYLVLSKLDTSDNKIMVESAIAKKRLEGKKKESIITYTNKPYREVFNETGQKDLWLQSIRYRSDIGVDENEKPIFTFKGTITRECYFAIRMNFEILINQIIPHALKLASVRNHHLKISSESASKPKPEPVVIKFENDLFLDIKKNESYLESIATMPSCSISKYHNNPYVHASLVDYRDGSSYDLWILAQNRLIIIPRFEASMASMSRLVNHIFERIAEGKVEKFEELKQSN